MKLIISGKEIQVRDTDYEIARQAVDRFLDTIKKGAADNNMPTLYLTVIAVLYTKSERLLKHSSQALQEILELVSSQMSNEIKESIAKSNM